MMKKKARLDEIAAEIAAHREFLEQAPNLTQYERSIRLAQLSTLGSELEDQRASLERDRADVQRLERAAIEAGLMPYGNDNA